MHSPLREMEASLAGSKVWPGIFLSSFHQSLESLRAKQESDRISVVGQFACGSRERMRLQPTGFREALCNRLVMAIPF